MLKVCVCLSSTSKRTRTDILGNNADKLGVEVVLPQPKLNFPQIFREDIILLKILLYSTGFSVLRHEDYFTTKSNKE